MRSEMDQAKKRKSYSQTFLDFGTQVVRGIAWVSEMDQVEKRTSIIKLFWTCFSRLLHLGCKGDSMGSDMDQAKKRTNNSQAFLYFLNLVVLFMITRKLYTSDMMDMIYKYVQL
jgi:hypothetical protein